ncbi:MAG: dephospho-CoA kinase [Endozoicomonadaceae bacterium]|nr:dephospho-CoA kinase [Endozoicomonadaceae bacterium]
MSFIIGLTGGIGCGKSTVANFFKEKGIQIIDADQIARDIIEQDHNILQKIQNYFGTQIITQDHQINRKLLRTRIFESHKEKTWLENLLHPLILTEMTQQIENNHSLYAIIVSPLLLEKNQYKWADRILVIDIEEPEQIIRTIARDQCSDAEVKAIITAQISRDERLKMADDIVYNNRSMYDLTPHLESLHHLYCETAQTLSSI